MVPRVLLACESVVRCRTIFIMEFGWEDFVQMAVADKIKYEFFVAVLNETRRRWPAGRSEYFRQREADLLAFECFSLAVLRSASPMEGVWNA